MRVFQNFRGRRRVFLGFFEGFLLALESLFFAVSASSFFPRFSCFKIFFDLIFFKFYFFGHFSIFRHRKIINMSLFRQKPGKGFFLARKRFFLRPLPFTTLQLYEISSTSRLSDSCCPLYDFTSLPPKAYRSKVEEIRKVVKS